jgi:branched-chain amino acid transport system ATP-binding protein
MNGPLLAVDGLRVRYGALEALFGVSFEVSHGSVLAVLGTNGAGKSTVARAVSGLVPAYEGTVTFDGQDIIRMHPYRIRRAGLVHIPEGRGIYPGLSVQENVRMAVLRVGTRDQRAMRTTVCTSCFPFSANGGPSAPAPSPAASSRCSRWRARSPFRPG